MIFMHIHMMIFCHPFGAPSIASHCPPIPLQPLVMVYRWYRFGIQKCLWFFFSCFLPLFGHVSKKCYLCSMNDNLNSHSISAKEKELERALRPSGFDSFAGQHQVVENLKVFVRAAKERGEPLDHVLLYGPPGLGKTTLSNIIANELGVASKSRAAPCSTSRATSLAS